MYVHLTLPSNWKDLESILLLLITLEVSCFILTDFSLLISAFSTPQH